MRKNFFNIVILAFVAGCTYTGAGDTVKESITLSIVDPEINGLDVGYIDIGNMHDNNSYNEDVYNLNRNGEWGTSFEYGVIKGLSRCSAHNGKYDVVDGYNTDSSLWSSDEINLVNNSGKESTKCWCVITDFIPVDGVSQSLSDSLWVYNGTHHNASDCDFFCAYSCADNIKKDSDFRTAILSVSK